MNLKLKTYLAAVSLLFTASMANSQDLQQEIEVQHDVVIDHYNAQRVAVTPQLQLPAITVKPLSYSERTVGVRIPSAISFLEPTAYADTLATSPYNGYASIGYFPIYNLGISAGYRIIDNDHSRLNAWLQFDGNSYKDSRSVNNATGTKYDRYLHRNTASIGLSYHLMVGKRSEIDAGLDYTFARFNAPGAQSIKNGLLMNDLYNQTVNKVNASLQWMSGIGGFAYTAGVDYGYFGYKNGFETTMLGQSLSSGSVYDASACRPVRENVIRFNAAGSLPLSEYGAAYLGLDLDVVNNNRRSYIESLNDGDFGYSMIGSQGSYTHALLSLKPRYRVKNSNFLLSIGALVQLSFNADKVFHVAPDVLVSWTPAPEFTIWGKSGGGEHLNTLRSLYDVNYMTAPMIAYRNSHIPITVEGGIIAGPFRGAYAELFGGYAVANEWLMPVGFPGIGFAPSMFAEVDMKGWHAGLRLGYKYRNWVDAKLSGEAAPSKWNQGYYLWRDRAKYVVKAEVTSNPIERLDVGISYELRCRRSIIDRCHEYVGANIHTYQYRYNLGNISNLGINGAYHFTPRLTVFLEIENLLNHRAQTLGLVEDQGIKGLAGVSYKF